MKPNYKNAALKAALTLGQYKTDDALSVLKKMTNVLVIAFGSNDLAAKSEIDAITVMSQSEGKARYIVIYNQNVSQVRLRFALARELGHIVLEHDDQISEEIREEEASSFAHYFLCPLTFPVERKEIKYRPKHQSHLWEMKSIVVFDNIDMMKNHVVDSRNKFNKFVGKSVEYKAQDVELTERSEIDHLTGWKNCCDVVIDGKIVGYCGE